MEIGFMVLPRSLEETRAVAQLGERLGFSWISAADSPTVYQDSYLHQLEIARAAPSVKVGPMVSHVVARHPVIVGNLLSTLNSFTGGRAIGTLATGNSAARGLGMKPARLADLADAVTAIQGYWRGEGGRFRDTQIPVSGLVRDACPLLIAADGQKGAELSGQVGDGLLYGGTMAPEVRQRRLAASQASTPRTAWIAPTVSLAEDRASVRDDLGAMVVAMANRAMRGDLDERAVPAAVQADVLEMRRAYDYGFHADNSRPRNTGVVSERLTNHLIDSLCVWGDEARWAKTLDELAADGWSGVMLILGQAEQISVVQAVGERLQRLGWILPRS
ncbi:LLM class flavin-dependent oxidoreductase [Conexibacter sp. CPCC 206217]|uniref:LLM class flavin-dependent oxidoreductase n=1 Tax=Conexibacter sp. CPCC 206217 TaxID=3064574 RepID=UPI00271EF7B1|nr:LLM class flavin-dependent oxidoreductase [Conexibacter sp. CPCC 206217]MDO8212462.1 LLM class flavin-dependent oxidoreductase [Conexibacter sp. CPCC 206217]